MQNLALDFKQAWRSLLRSRTATSAAVVCLALGIGANVTMLRVLDLLFFRPPAHVRSPDTLRRIYFSVPMQGGGTVATTFTSYRNYADLQAGAGGLASLALFYFADAQVSFSSAAGPTSARRVHATLVTGNYWQALGVQPALGRLFGESEAQVGRPSFVALVSQELAQRQWGSTSALGQRIWVGHDAYTVVGVSPRHFTGIDAKVVDLWLPINAMTSLGSAPGWYEPRGSKFLELLARVRGGRPERSIEAEMTSTYRRVSAAEDGPSLTTHVLFGPVQRAWGPGASLDARVSLWLTGISFVVLLIACANVANLSIVRALSRQGELALRFALGSGRARVLRLLFAEAVLLVGLGGLAGFGLVLLGDSLVRTYLLPQGIAATDLFAPRSLALLGSTLLAAIFLCGLLPAAWASRTDLAQTMKLGSTAGGGAGLSLRGTLLVGQVALTLCLLVGAGLFLSSLAKLRGKHLGLDVDHLLLATIDPPGAAQTSKRQADALYGEALERVRHLPGIERASLASSLPFVSSQTAELDAPGVTEAPANTAGGPYIYAVGDDFFATVGTALRRGRTFEPSGREARSAVVNETMERAVWRKAGALGKCLQIGPPPAPCSTVVGVVEDARLLGVQEQPRMLYYVPLAQVPDGLRAKALLMRVAGDPAALAGSVARELRPLAPPFSLVEVQPLADSLAPELHPWRLGTVVFSLFGLLALVLSGVGIHGVIAYTVEQRSPELGLRIALGARGEQILWLVLRRTLVIVGLGILLGLGLALLAGRTAQPLLFETSAVDPKILSLAVLVLVSVAVSASLLPGWKVQRIDPVVTLRQT